MSRKITRKMQTENEKRRDDSMKKQIFNPYLPLDTYIPDGEPHVFGDRLYIFGSHDGEGADAFCILPYECWSAPLSDLSDFRCEGTIYEANQDPSYSEKQKYMYAPDVVQGNDGRFYLYYAMSGEGCFTGPIHVAVCDTPGGKYEYYGAVQMKNGEPLDLYITFDPAVMNDNGKIWLYYGWSLAAEGAGCSIPEETKIQSEMMVFGKNREEITKGTYPYMGANAVELEEDMLTVKTEPVRIVPGQFESEGTSFENHAFFEASSMRKIGERYYFIYSSQFQHELCYATSKYPDRDFVYGGTIISNGDIGLNGRTSKNRLYITGNNHGSIEKINDEWFVFYHRHTHKSTYSRQGCAEKIVIEKDGTIAQVPITSCGLNGGPLLAAGKYPAAICCNLTNGKMPHQETKRIEEVMPHITHEGAERFISEIVDGTMIGYKYFEFDGSKIFSVKYRGKGTGVLRICTDEKELGKIVVNPAASWTEASMKYQKEGVHAFYLYFEGEGTLDIREIGFE